MSSGILSRMLHFVLFNKIKCLLPEKVRLLFQWHGARRANCDILTTLDDLERLL